MALGRGSRVYASDLAAHRVRDIFSEVDAAAAVKIALEVQAIPLPASPPAEKANASKDKTGQSSTSDGAWYRHRSWRSREPPREWS
jgi:hypothetical protein